MSQRLGLDAVRDFELPPALQEHLRNAVATAGGSTPWKRRKGVEAHDFLALSALAPEGRMTVHHLDLRQALRAVVALDVPVALRSSQEGQVAIRRGVMLGISYVEEAMWQPMPGYAFVQIIAPQGVWHPNVAAEPPMIQPLCLGASMPAGIRAMELVLLAYGALAMQTVTVDPQDAAGVMNVEAARYWQANMDKLPLTDKAFLERE